MSVILMIPYFVSCHGHHKLWHIELLVISHKICIQSVLLNHKCSRDAVQWQFLVSLLLKAHFYYISSSASTAVDCCYRFDNYNKYGADSDKPKTTINLKIKPKNNI